MKDGEIKMFNTTIVDSNCAVVHNYKVAVFLVWFLFCSFAQDGGSHYYPTPPRRRITRTPGPGGSVGEATKFVTSFGHFSADFDLASTPGNGTTETATLTSQSVAGVSAGTDESTAAGGERINRNITQLIDRLLDGYDAKVRPPGTAPKTTLHSVARALGIVLCWFDWLIDFVIK